MAVCPLMHEFVPSSIHTLATETSLLCSCHLMTWETKDTQSQWMSDEWMSRSDHTSSSSVTQSSTELVKWNVKWGHDEVPDHARSSPDSPAAVRSRLTTNPPPGRQDASSARDSNVFPLRFLRVLPGCEAERRGDEVQKQRTRSCLCGTVTIRQGLIAG